jgi:hypothetical protein
MPRITKTYPCTAIERLSSLLAEIDGDVDRSCRKSSHWDILADRLRSLCKAKNMTTVVTRLTPLRGMEQHLPRMQLDPFDAATLRDIFFTLNSEVVEHARKESVAEFGGDIVGRGFDVLKWNWTTRTAMSFAIVLQDVVMGFC